MGKFSFEEVNELYVDVLREIGNIGSGNATTAIASMLDLRLNMNVPKVELLSFQEFGSAISAEDETIVGIYLGLEQDIEGSMMFLMKLDSAHYLVNGFICDQRDRKYYCRFLLVSIIKYDKPDDFPYHTICCN